MPCKREPASRARADRGTPTMTRANGACLQGGGGEDARLVLHSIRGEISAAIQCEEHTASTGAPSARRLAMART